LRDEAALVRRLAKPPATAWAVNQLWWHERATVEALLDAGTRLRLAQQAVLAGERADLRDAIEARQTAVSAAVERATLALGGPGRVSQPFRQRIAATCDALAVTGWPDEVRPGCLTGDLASPGLAALAGLSGARLDVTPPQGRPSEAPEAARRAVEAAERVLDEQAQRVRQAKAAAEEAERAAEQAAGRVETLEGELRIARGSAAAASAAFEVSARELAQAIADHAAAIAGVERARREWATGDSST
jgi:hypothetical protein